jgi:hypothetical protein
VVCRWFEGAPKAATALATVPPVPGVSSVSGSCSETLQNDPESGLENYREPCSPGLNRRLWFAIGSRHGCAASVGYWSRSLRSRQVESSRPPDDCQTRRTKGHSGSPRHDQSPHVTARAGVDPIMDPLNRQWRFQTILRTCSIACSSAFKMPSRLLWEQSVEGADRGGCGVQRRDTHSWNSASTAGSSPRASCLRVWSFVASACGNGRC